MTDQQQLITVFRSDASMFLSTTSFKSNESKCSDPEELTSKSSNLVNDSYLTSPTKPPSPETEGTEVSEIIMGNEIKMIMDPMELKMNKHICWPSASKQVSQLRAKEASKKHKENVKPKTRAIASKVRAEKTKAKVLHILEWHVMYKLIQNRMRIYEVEKLKHVRNEELHKEMIEEKKEKILNQMKVNLKNVLEEEVEKQREMKKHIFEEEISLIAAATEAEVKNKYENYLMKLKLAELKEDYQHEMNEYCVYWKKMAYKICTEIEKYKLQVKKNASFYENQRILECLLNVESKCRKKAKESLKENILMVDKILRLIPPKQRELSIYKKENDKLEKTIGQWQNIVPDVIIQMKKFVELTFNDSPEKQALLESINGLLLFKDTVPEKVEVPTKSSISDTLEEFMTIEKGKETDYRGRQLMKIKEKIIEALSFFQEPLITKDMKTREAKLSKKEKPKLNKNEFITRINEIINLSESLVEVVGSKYSLPDFENPRNFMEKRTISINEILQEGK